MKLTYRGAQYNYTPRSAVNVQETTVSSALRPTFSLHYRGSVYTVDPNAEPNLPVLKPAAQLVYRGNAYALNGWTKPAAMPSTFSAASDKPRFSHKASSNAKFATVHRTNLQTNVQRRLQVARERGDQNLINLLERELQQFV